MTSDMIYIVALGIGLKCPRKIHLNTECPPPRNFQTFRRIWFIIDRSRERMTNNVRKSIEYSYKNDKIKRRGGLIMSQFNTMSLPIQRIEGKPNCATTPNPPLANNHWKVKLLYNYIPVTVYTF